MIRTVSFNVNGIRARFHQLEALKKQYNPDIIGLQEIKVHDDEFPIKTTQIMGWHTEHYGQKGHYGVALLSKTPPVYVQKGFPWKDINSQRRFIHARYQLNGHTINVINGYFPQGESCHHDTKFPAKKEFYQDLNRYLSDDLKNESHIIVMGDMNISPEDTDIGIGDTNRKRWLKAGKCSFLPEERQWYQALLNHKLQDCYRLFYPNKNDEFSWFDYRSKGFQDTPKRGLRIDHILVSPKLATACQAVGIAYDIRGMEKPSDHAPIWSDFQFKT